jgi:hypothetical protein
MMKWDGVDKPLAAWDVYPTCPSFNVSFWRTTFPGRVYPHVCIAYVGRKDGAVAVVFIILDRANFYTHAVRFSKA